MKELLFFSGALAGMTAAALIYAWDARIKNRRKKYVPSYPNIAPWPASGSGPFTVEVQGKYYLMTEKVWDEEDCWLCWCGKSVTPDEIHNTNGVRCWGDV